MYHEKTEDFSHASDRVGVVLSVRKFGSFYRTEDGADLMAPHVKDQVDATPPVPLPQESRLSLDPTLKRQGAVDGGWWPRSRSANVELPDLVSSLNAQAGSVVRLGIDARDWDDIPRLITVGGHPVRIGRFANLNHKIIVTLSQRDHILLLVVPSDASTAAAKSALARAATGRNCGRPEEILAPSGIQHETRANPPQVIPEDHDPPPGPGIRFAGTEATRAPW
jgi:hypothetical protein